MKKIEQNELFTLAEKWVNETNRTIFLTGKAGTGKTTFLKHIKETTHKNTVVLAPTGIAAINASGSTLHSFFRLPFGTFLPTYTAPTQEGKIITQQSLPSLLRYTKQHIYLLRTIELLIIDEVSMVRADVLDMIDIILRRFRMAPHLPFGGVQVLFIGDMYQLPPVVKDYEARLLADYYASPYFFDSMVLKNDPPVIIALEKVYRQQEFDFLSLLNELRHNNLSQENYEKLLAKVVRQPPADDQYITLTSHVLQSDRINEQALEKLTTPERTFHAKTEGDFPEQNYPATTELLLKIGARVMFIKNDPERKYFNGKTGKVVKIHDDQVEVQCDDNTLITVDALAWHNVKYETDATTGKIEEKIIGKFWQLPLRLAWAVTIHKSQGLTFDKVIIDAERAFASGQVYVALSRCRTWEGIVLLSKIKPEALFTDNNITLFSSKTWNHAQLENNLSSQRHAFQREKITDAFDLSLWKKEQEQLSKTLLEFETSFPKDSVQYMKQLLHQLQNIATISEKFLWQLEQLIQPSTLPEEDAAVIKRVKEAAVYFHQTTQKDILPLLTSLPEPPDSSAVASKVLQLLESWYASVQMHVRMWATLQHEVSVTVLLQAKAKGLQEASKATTLRWGKRTSKNTIPSSSTNNSLLNDLRNWRKGMANTLGVDPYMVLSNKAIDGIVAQPPLHKKTLLSISGIGKKKLQDYGDAILDIISRYFDLQEEEIDFEKESAPQKKKTTSAVGNTYQDTLLLYRAGMDIKQIAASRGLSLGTIATHFSRLIELQEIPIRALLTLEKEQSIRNIINQLQGATNILSQAKEKLGDGYDYSEIRWVMAQLKNETASKE